ncbi:MAG: hypothetical protein NTX75_05250 [Proteobacteria bacterium]|nr:hypothetical protein [Pseudomonadota bacterium]
MDMIKCPYCGKEVKPVRYGSGWVGICCGRVAYNCTKIIYQTDEKQKEDSSNEG